MARTRTPVTDAPAKRTRAPVVSAADTGGETLTDAREAHTVKHGNGAEVFEEGTGRLLGYVTRGPNCTHANPEYLTIGVDDVVYVTSDSHAKALIALHDKGPSLARMKAAKLAEAASPAPVKRRRK